MSYQWNLAIDMSFFSSTFSKIRVPHLFRILKLNEVSPENDWEISVSDASLSHELYKFNRNLKKNHTMIDFYLFEFSLFYCSWKDSIDY